MEHIIAHPACQAKEVFPVSAPTEHVHSKEIGEEKKHVQNNVVGDDVVPS